MQRQTCSMPIMESWWKKWLKWSRTSNWFVIFVSASIILVAVILLFWFGAEGSKRMNTVLWSKEIFRLDEVQRAEGKAFWCFVHKRKISRIFAAMNGKRSPSPRSSLTAWKLTALCAWALSSKEKYSRDDREIWVNFPKQFYVSQPTAISHPEILRAGKPHTLKESR